MKMYRNELFCNENLNVLAGDARNQLLRELGTLSDERLLKEDIDGLSDDFERAYMLKIPELNENEITQTDGEIDEPLSSYVSFNHERPTEKVSTVTFHIPFNGNGRYFEYKPSHFTTVHPLALIEDSEIKISYSIKDYDATKVKQEFESDLSLIKQYLEWLSVDFGKINQMFKSEIKRILETRKTKIIKTREMMGAIGYPIKRRDSVAQIYEIPVTRKRIIENPEIKDKQPNIQEPLISEMAYDDILSVISSMSLVMERNPRVFNKLKEEEIRTLFLMFLNGHFEGNATGETFNYKGKTDILIRENNKNIFIAECKFWPGEKKFLKTIDQLLGYTSWRDTKTAILIFNRNKDHTSTLQKIDKVARGHPNFIKPLSYKSESGFRYLYCQKDDKDKKLLLTIIAFPIPIEEK